MNFSKMDTSRYFPLLKLFIIFQPIIDIITFFMIDFFDANVTFGIIIRMFFMLISLLYIFWGNSSRFKKSIIIYLLFLFFVLGINLTVSYFYKPTFNLIAEVQWITKISYFLIMFTALFLLINSSNFKVIKDGVLRSIYIAMTLLTTSIIIAIVTNTSTNTYEWVLYGYKGWFFSGNEIGAIISIAFPLVTLYSINKTVSFHNYLYWIPTGFLAITGFLLGTKVGFLSISITLISTLVILIVQNLTQKGIARYSTIFIGLILIVVTLFSPFAPSIKNFSVDMPIPDKDNIVDNQTDSKEDIKAGDKGGKIDSEEKNEKVEEPKLPTILDSKIVNKVLSSRHFYFTRQYFQFTEANLLQKLFGMGYSGNYIHTVKTIEMDILDVFFTFGIIGSLLVFMPFLISLYFICRLIFQSIKFFFKLDIILLLISLALGIGVSIIAGHVMFAPAVSLYFAIPIVFLLTNSIDRLREIKT